MRLEEFAVLFEGAGRASVDEILADSLRGLARHPLSYYHLLRVANSYWRLGEWSKAAEFSSRAARLKPESFVAWRILTNSQSQLQQWDACLDSARKLLAVSPPDWRKARQYSWWLLPFSLLRGPRSRLRWWKEQAAMEQNAEMQFLEWARSFVATQENGTRDAA
jgi:tetratricopeptide (TPR) repeat protein